MSLKNTTETVLFIACSNNYDSISSTSFFNFLESYSFLNETAGAGGEGGATIDCVRAQEIINAAKTGMCIGVGEFTIIQVRSGSGSSLGWGKRKS